MLFWSLGKAVSVFNGSLRDQMYATGMVQSILMGIAAYFIFLASRRLVADWIAWFAGGVVLLIALSSYMAMSFWSEPIAFLFMSIAVYLTVDTCHQRSATFGQLTVRAILVGLVLGGLIITRATPVALLLAGLIMTWIVLRSGPALLVSFVSMSIVVLVITIQMFANNYRVGRYELTGSAPFHLWNVITLSSDEILADSGTYAALKRAIPEPQGRLHWSISDELEDKGVPRHKAEAMIRDMVAYAITEKPAAVAIAGAGNSLQLILTPPDQFGLWPYRHEDVRENPLGRETHLPTLVSMNNVATLLNSFHRVYTQLYPFIVLLSLAAATGSLLFVGWGLIRRPEPVDSVEPRVAAGPNAVLTGTLLLAYSGMTYLTASIETVLPRYQILITPIFVMLVVAVSSLVTPRHPV